MIFSCFIVVNAALYFYSKRKICYLIKRKKILTFQGEFSLFLDYFFGIGSHPILRRFSLYFDCQILLMIRSSFLWILFDQKIQLEPEHLQQERQSLAVMILRSNDDVQLRRHCKCGSKQEAHSAELNIPLI